MPKADPGRNDPCPCESGLKFKKCHGRTAGTGGGPAAPTFPPLDGKIIRERNRGVNWTIGSGTQFTVFIEGEYKRVEASPGEHVFVIVADIPILIPLDNGTFHVHVLENDFKVLHERKQRGQELFSTLDSDALPVFSSLRVQGNMDVQLPAADSGPDRYYRIIEAVVRKFDGFLREQGLSPILSEEFPELSYRVVFYRRGSKRKPVAVATYPFSGPVTLPSHEDNADIDEASLRTYLAQKLSVERFVRTDILPRIAGSTFQARVRESLVRFAFYCRQQAQSLHGLREPQIGGLFLVVGKMLFGAAEGEAFHYDGKLDFKISNPDDFLEFVTGEFKWWNGPASFEEAFGQITRKHATGQESELHLVILSRTKSISGLPGKIEKVLENQKEFVTDSLMTIPREETGNELVLECRVVPRERSIVLRIYVVDLSYVRV